MKISNNEQILKSQCVEPNHNTKSPAAKEFNTILKESVENTQRVDVKHQPSTAIHPFSGIQPITSPPPDGQFNIERIENLIDLLDQYRQKLADPDVTLKKIDPLIEEMAHEKEKLNPILDSLRDDDSLKPILNQTLVTASLEIAKYYRGDYLTV